MPNFRPRRFVPYWFASNLASILNRSPLLVLTFVLLFSAYAAGSSAFADDSTTIRAVWFDRGNLLVGTSYSDGAPCLMHNGKAEPDSVEYDVDFPESGRYAVSFLYAAEASRPVELSIDGNVVAESVCAGTTGSWRTSTARWERGPEVEIAAGKRVVRLYRSECFPHICAIRFEPLFELATPWANPRPTAKKRALDDVSNDVASLPWPVEWFAEVAFDRRAKQESGGVFTDHFALESAVALLPEDVDFELVEVDETASAGAAFDPNDELTYRRESFAEPTENDESPNPADAARVAVKVRVPNGLQSPIVDGTTFVLTPARFKLLIDKTRGMIAAYSERFSEDELADAGATPERLAEIAERLDAAQTSLDNETFDAAILSGSDDESATALKKRFATDFFRTIRDYSFVARANPVLDFDSFLCVRRNPTDLGLPQNWQSNSVLNPEGFDDALTTVDLRGENGLPTAPRVFFKPDYSTFIGDLTLNFDADKLLFSATRRERDWNLFELDLNAVSETTLEEATAKTGELMTPQIPPLEAANHYDGCYLGDGSIVYTSSACYSAVPCVNGFTRVTNLFRKYPDGSIRRLTFDQEHNWRPVVTPDGRILYLRWEYTDAPHVPARLLFLTNPDGTNQRAFYGSNSYWPNSMFYARPIPGDVSKFVAVVGGHHGVCRMGELVLFDVSKGRKETSGALMRICAKEKIVASKTDPKYDDTLIVDNLVDEAWPKFLHPRPLSENYFVVAAQPRKGDDWGIYLVDTEDDMTLLAQVPGFALLEPVPIQATDAPPVPADRVDLSRDDATVYISDVYEGPGLKDVPRGTVEKLRILSYDYLFPNMGGPQGTVGAEGPWDVKRILGTVPVEPSGAAMFRVPANTPFAVQPLDKDGKALQLMRSWTTAMPGEALSCVGCHEDENSASSTDLDAADATRIPTREIEPWRGKERGFSFEREVQPVLNRYCVGCHNGEVPAPGNPDVKAFDLRGLVRIDDYSSVYHSGTKAGRFSTSYVALHRWVRRPGMESDYHLQKPTEFSAETTDLYKILKKGHYGLKLDAESWDRLITWIDFNAPYYGTWGEQAETPDVAVWNDRRRAIKELYSNVAVDEEAIEPTTFGFDESLPDSFELAQSLAPTPLPTFVDWSFDSDEAKRRQAEAAERLFGDASATEKRIALDGGVELVLKLVPAGKFVAGAQSPDANGSLLIRSPDETPRETQIERPIWVATLETTNRLYELFDPAHDSGVESRYAMQFGVRGFYVNAPELPVVRVSWNEANDFCRWLSEKTGMKFRLPTADEAEWAARAGTSTPFWYGGLDSDFSTSENLCDAKTRDFVCHPYFKEVVPLGGTKYDQWLPKDERFNDGSLLSAAPGNYSANPWGLYDVVGNVAEWTSTDAKTDEAGEGESGKVVKGGSWRDRPIAARAESRSVYRPWQGVYNVGFRVVAEVE